jgi:hypothetical protein
MSEKERSWWPIYEPKKTYSASSLIPVVGVDTARWNQSPSSQDISSTASALEARGMRVVLVENGSQALDALKKMIPGGESVMNGSSATLNEIGYHRKNARMAEPYIGHFLWQYSRNEHEFHAITRVLPFFMSLGLLRMARLGQGADQRDFIFREAKACLESGLCR